MKSLQKALISFLMTVLVAFFTISATPSDSNAGFASGVLFGAVLFGDSGSTPDSGRGGVIYMLPNVSERVTQPLEIKMVCVKIGFGPRSLNTQKDTPLKKIFSDTIEGSEKYEILEILRVPQANEMGSLWFSYIDKKFIKEKNN